MGNRETVFLLAPKCDIQIVLLTGIIALVGIVPNWFPVGPAQNRFCSFRLMFTDIEDMVNYFWTFWGPSLGPSFLGHVSMVLGNFFTMKLRRGWPQEKVLTKRHD